MPRLPKGIFKRRGSRSYYTKAKIRGKGVWRSLGPDREEAVRKYRLIQSQGGLRALVEGNAEGLQREDSEATVAEIGERWLREYVATRRNEQGRKLARARFHSDMVPAIGHLRVPEVQPNDFRQLRLRLEGRGLSPQTVMHILSDARCLFRYIADELRLISRSPFPPRLMPRIEQAAPRRLSDEDISLVLGSIPEDHAFLVRLALTTGLRWGEVKRLEWRHVDLRSRLIIVEHSKSGKVRRIPITAEMAETLKRRFAESDSLFVSPFQKTDAGSFVRHVRKLSGVEAFGFHKLRHTFACQWLEAGGSKEALQQVLGHSTIRLTEIYGKLSDNFVKLEAEGVAVGVAARLQGAQEKAATSMGQVDNSLSRK